MILPEEEILSIRELHKDNVTLQKAFTRAIINYLPGGDEYTDFNPFNHIISNAQIVKGWRLDSSTPRKAILEGRIKETEYLKLGRDLIFLRSSIERLYGTQKHPINDDDE